MIAQQKPRDLGKIIDQIVLVVPELEIPLASIRRKVPYCAPEIMWVHWRGLQEALTERDHRFTEKQRAMIQAIIAGRSS